MPSTSRPRLWQKEKAERSHEAVPSSPASAAALYVVARLGLVDKLQPVGEVVKTTEQLEEELEVRCIGTRGWHCIHQFAVAGRCGRASGVLW